MNDFERLKMNWKAQPIQQPSETNFNQLKNRIRNVTQKQKLANVILLVTIAILIVFFFYIGAMEFTNVALALGAMIMALVVRVIIEFFSQEHLKNLTTTLSIEHFKEKLHSYYKGRIVVHVILTPLLLGIYSYAFWTLLPDFKATLSTGLYNYIVWSSLVLLVFFTFFIFFQIRKEVKELKELKD